jgi:predicted kinase
MSKPTLHLLMGLPGAGKSTLAEKIEKLSGATLLSSDETRVAIFKEPCFSQQEHDYLYDILDHNVEHLLRAGKDVIYDANLNRKQHRTEKYDMARRFGANVSLWWVKAPVALAKNRRIEEQDHLLIPEGETSEKMFDRIAAVMEEPDETENYISIDGRHITDQEVQKYLA